MIILEESKLIFIISQPRAGSTLLQRILGNHSQIHTVAEPWIMLPTVYALRDQGYEAEYDSKISSRAIKLFLQKLPNSEEDFYHGIRLMYQFIYGQVLQNSEKSHFLDKTPRYYYIISELYSIFPNAKFILLVRNPLDVFNSILDTWVKDNWYALYRYRDDLLKAPNFLLKGKKKLGEKAYIVKYEKLVSETENTINLLCNYIGVDYEPEIANYNCRKIDKFELGDPKNVYKYKQTNSSSLDKWANNLQNPQTWRLFKEYLEEIGEDTLDDLGYSYQKYYQIITQNAPSKLSVYFTKPLHWLIRKPKDVRHWSFEWLFRIYFCNYRNLKQIFDKS